MNTSTNNIFEEFRQLLRSRGRVTLLLAAANVLVFLALSIMGNTENVPFMLAHGACYAPFVANGQYWRLFSSMFLHFGAVHLLYNMLCLLTLGDLLEKAIGPMRYALIYFLGGSAGNVLSVFWELRTGGYAVSAGASGAIFAVIGALLLVVIRRSRREAASGPAGSPADASRHGAAFDLSRSQADAYQRGDSAQRRAVPGNIPLQRMALMVVLMIAQGFFEQGTDNLAHIGGCVGGFVIALLMGLR